MGVGFLEVEVFTGDHVLPIRNATVIIKDHNGQVLYTLVSDEHGHTEKVSLDAPDKNNTIDPNSGGPGFSVYDVEVPMVQGYKRVIIHNTQIYDTVTSILPVQLHPAQRDGTPVENTDEIDIPREHGVEQPRDVSEAESISEAARMPYTPGTNGESEPYDPPLVYTQNDPNNRYDPPTDRAEPGIYLNPAAAPFAVERIMANEVAIPEYITVHLGSPNATARNVRVPFKDYVKNVASSEIFPTWEPAAIQANIYCQISFVLNRVYTLWYRSRGKDFDITNSTAFDQFFVEGREIFQNISQIVDGIFNMFIRRPGRREPFFASYCNGTTSTCAGLSQWGSQYLAQQGYTPLQILRYYFPNDVQIVESTNFANNVGVFPGSALREGDRGNDVRMMQTYLNRISGNWYIPPVGIPDGIFGAATKNTVMEFQSIFNLVPDGIIGSSTWYEITKIYVAVKELAELTSEGERISIGASPPNVTLQVNARGEYVIELQFLLNFISTFFPSIPFVIQNSVFRDDTKRGVIEFQSAFGLTPDGIVGPGTWQKLYQVYYDINSSVQVPTPPPGTPDIPAFPGTPLRLGSTGNDVLLMQRNLNAIAKYYPAIPTLTADGVFGPLTQTAVIAFQRQFGLAADGVIGQITWYKIIEVYDLLPPAQTPPFPGSALQIGSRGDNVRLMQTYLNAIHNIFPVIPGLTADGIFGAGTRAAVIAFQSFFGLTPDGIIGVNTWNRIVDVYNRLPSVSVPPYPGIALRYGASGANVIILQKYLNTIATQYPSIPQLTADGIFGSGTQQAVTAFQRQFGLTADGIVGMATWHMLVSVYNAILMNNPGIVATVFAPSATDSVTYRPKTGSYPMDKLALLLAFNLLNKK